MWSILADFLVAFHLAYVSYVVVGQVLILLGWALRWSWVRNIWFRSTHLLAILIVAYETRIGMECPLTTLEYWLRGDEAGPSFIGRTLRRIMFYSSAEVAQETLNTSYYIFALVVILTFFLLPPRLPRRSVVNEATTNTGCPVENAPGSPTG